jgi:hypothetical protein
MTGYSPDRDWQIQMVPLIVSNSIFKLSSVEVLEIVKLPYLPCPFFNGMHHRLKIDSSTSCVCCSKLKLYDFCRLDSICNWSTIELYQATSAIYNQVSSHHSDCVSESERCFNLFGQQNRQVPHSNSQLRFRRFLVHDGISIIQLTPSRGFADCAINHV